jgi:creatinine amidohydrolase/Fe(II)-dependent formamide hydrolase-like protein
MLMAIHPELVHVERAQAGYTGDADEAFRKIFTAGTASLSKIGVVGDPSRASAAHGKRYWEVVTEATLDAIAARGGNRSAA